MRYFGKFLHRHPLLRQLLVITGVRRLFRILRPAILLVRYGRQKRIIVNGKELLFSIKDDNSLKFFCDPYWFGELHEKAVALHLVDRLKGCRCFIDIGAYLGFYTVLAAKMIQDWGGMVHAIEMNIDSIKHLQENVRLNRLKNVTLHHLALGDRVGEAHYFQRGGALNTLEMHPHKAKFYERVLVQMTTGDNLIEVNAMDPDIIKIDVEGAEYLVLCGMKNILKKKNVRIYCEVHLYQERGEGLFAFGHTMRDIFEIFRKNGFEIKQLRLRQDSHYEETVIHDPHEVKESTMLYAYK